MISSQMGNFFAKVVLLDATPIIMNMQGAPIPCLVSAYPNTGTSDSVSVEQSNDQGLTWNAAFVIPATAAAANQQLNSGCTHLRCTRTAGTSALSYVTVC